MRVVLGSFHVKNSLGVENDDQLRTKIRRVQYQQKNFILCNNKALQGAQT